MRLLISGGGTGGHIYPALALIEQLKKMDPSSEVLYVGTKRGLESKIVPDHHIDFKTLEIQGFKRSLSLQNFKTVYLFMKSVHDSKKIIREFKPDVVVGTGGYVCGAVVYAASRMHIPTMIHEQNSVAGVTNKFLSHFVDKIGICFDGVAADFPKEKVVMTGNPRATQVANIQPQARLQTFGLAEGKPTVLIFGGSRGARRINEATLAAAPKFANSDYQVLFVTGSVYYDKIKQQLPTLALPDNFKVVPYVNDMPSLLPEISLIVGRAGATSLAEITALGIASILIPSPNVTNDHQTKNARDLVKHDAAKMLVESDLAGQSLFSEIDYLMQDSILRTHIANNAKKLGKPQAAQVLVEQLEQLINAK